MQLNNQGGYLAEVSDRINELIIGNEKVKNKFCEHIGKVIQKAEKYGQYLRAEWQKAKEAGLTQYDKNKEKGEWFWWTAYSKDWTWGECVYFADGEWLDAQFYIEGKPKPDPLAYLHSMIWGAVGEVYDGLELLDYQFVLLAIIHDAQNWQAGRQRIYFNALERGTLSDRLCRAVWHHLQSEQNSYGFKDVPQTIETALRAVKPLLKNVELQASGKAGETEQNTTSIGRKDEKWYWKLYEKTLKVVVDAVLEKLWLK